MRSMLSVSTGVASSANKDARARCPAAASQRRCWGQRDRERGPIEHDQNEEQDRVLEGALRGSAICTSGTAATRTV